MERIIDITHKEKLSHLSSCLTTYPILKHIYDNKNLEDHVVLSNGHAGLAQYVILEELYKIDPINMIHTMGIHPCRDVSKKIDVSSGSLGSAILVATGMALGDRDTQVHCVLSDGECAEGSVWEALNFINKQKLKNIHVHVNVNGMSAYDEVDSENLIKRLQSFLPSINIWKTKSPDVEFMNGLIGHYYVLKDKDKDELINKYETTICTKIT